VAAEFDALLIAGPTASGKSALALHLAELVPAEIISVDSAQVYRGFDIGSAKPSEALREKIPHHLIDIRDPEESYSAGDFVNDALLAIEAVKARGRLPILVGGTMLYFNALIHAIAKLPIARRISGSAVDRCASRCARVACAACRVARGRSAGCRQDSPQRSTAYPTGFRGLPGQRSAD